MSINADDLFRLELRARTEAERLRNRWPETMLSDPSVPADTKVHARTKREIADDFDQIGNLLVGLQGDWDRLGPQVRAGYTRLTAEYEALKQRGQPAEDAA